MFHDLDSTLSTLLQQQLPPDLVAQISISFLTPDNQFPPASVQLPAVDLFLYDINENRELRDTHPTSARRPDGRVMATPFLLRMDCSYLITAWARSAVPAPEQDEHQMLGEVARVLLLHREIPAEVLQGSMKDQPLPIRGQIGSMGDAQARGEFWQALGDRPRAAIKYTVTICVEVQEPLDVGSVATDVRA